MISIIIFGGTGDLAKKKLFKSLYNLYCKNLIPKDTKIIGFARKDFNTDTYRDFVNENLPEGLELRQEFLELFYYFQGDLYQEQSYHDLKKFLIDFDIQYNICAYKLFYLSVRPELYFDVFEYLKKTNILHTCGISSDEIWSRVLIEKPFGTNFEHAQELDKQLASVISEDKIFRIDHYLAKEALENVLVFRFKNKIFNAIWNNNFISKISIRLFETRTVEGRGEFYDKVGALRDVGQNHALQMLAMVLMDEPESFKGQDIRKKREEVLKTLFLDEVRKEDFKRGQYLDYLDHIPEKQSETETYFKVTLYSNLPNWSSIPCVIESGKVMQKNETSIQIDFIDGNTIYFDLGENPRIAVSFQVKDSGHEYKTSIREFEFRDLEKNIFILEPYEKLLYQAIIGDVTSFVSTQEVFQQWKIIDQIIKNWGHIPLDVY